jgi:hypothetical protein
MKYILAAALQWYTFNTNLRACIPIQALSPMFSTTINSPQDIITLTHAYNVQVTPGGIVMLSVANLDRTFVLFPDLGLCRKTLASVIQSGVTVHPMLIQ